MSADGLYDVEVSMAGRKRALKVFLETQGVVLKGYIDGPFGKYSFHNGIITSNDVRWTINLKYQPEEAEFFTMTEESNPGFFRNLGKFVTESLSGPPIGTPPRPTRFKPGMDMPVQFSGHILGNQIVGDMKFGPYGTGFFKGLRIDR